jgi:hypothetical protein
MLEAFSYGIEPGWSLLECCQKLLAAAQKDYLPAKVIYRRTYEALMSIPMNEDVLAGSEPHIASTAIQDIDQDVFEAMDLIEMQHPDNFLAEAIGFYLQTFWSEEIQIRLIKMSGQVKEDMAIDPSSEEAEIIYRLESFIREGFSRMVATNPSLSEVQEAHDDLLFAGAILFDNDDSGLLDLACCTWNNLDLPLAFYMTSLPQKDMSPLALACALGKTDSVRTLCKYDSNSSMNRLQSSDKDIPLHHLILFPQDEIEEMFSLLSAGVDINHHLLADGDSLEGNLCYISGSPLDFALQVGSERAVEVLWPFFRRSTQWFFEDISGSMPHFSAMDGLVLDMIKCFGTCSLPIWERFVSDLSQEDKQTLRRYASSTYFDVDGGMAFLSAFVSMLSFNKVNHMLLHGSKYFQSMVLQLTNGIEFLTDVCGASFDSISVYGAFILLTDPDICLALSMSFSRVVNPPTVEIGFHQWVSYLTLTIPQFSWLRSTMGHGIPNHYDSMAAIFDIHAATKANNVPAVRRILERTRADGISLRDSAVVEYIVSSFAKKWSPGVKDCLEVIMQLDHPQKSWSAWLPSIFQPDNAYYITEAIKNYNENMVLFLLEDHTLFTEPSFSSPRLFFQLCMNDRHVMILHAVLNRLEPKDALRMITERTRRSRLSPLDLAVISGSIACLQALGRFLASKAKDYISSEEKMILILAMIQSAADVRVGIDIGFMMTGVFQSVKSPLSIPWAASKICSNLLVAPDLTATPAHIYCIANFARMVNVHQLEGYGTIDVLEER